MLVLSALYKAESLLSLGDTPPNVIHDLLAKCDAYVDRYSMQEDKDIMESIRSKKKSLLHYQATRSSPANSYEQLEEVRQTTTASSIPKQSSPKHGFTPSAGSNLMHSRNSGREQSAPKKNFVVKSKRGISTEARTSDHSYGSNVRTAAPHENPRPVRKSPQPLQIRRPSRDLGSTPNSRLSHELRDRDHSYARKRNAPRLTHDHGHDDLEFSYATMRQSHGGETGRGNFFKPKLKNQPSRIETDGSDPMVAAKDFLEDSERYEPEPEPEAEKPTTIGSQSLATKSTRPKSAVKIQSSQARKGFKEGLDGLLKLGDYLKSQIEKEVEEEERRKRKKGLGQRIFEDSFSGPEKSSIDKEINGKMNELLSSVAEWEKQRLVFQDRFQRLEKAIEKQSVSPIQATTSSPEVQVSNRMVSDKFVAQGPYAKRPVDEGSSSLVSKHGSRPSPDVRRPQEAVASRNSFKPEPVGEMGQRKSLKGPTTPLSIITPHSASKFPEVATPQGVPILSKNASAARSLMSVNSAAPIYSAKEMEDFSHVLEHCLQQLSSGAVPETEVFHNLDQHYLIVFQVRNSQIANSKKLAGSISLKLLKDNELLGEEILSAEDLRYLFQQVNITDTLSYHIPVSCFPDITHFLQHCLVKFVQFSEGPDGQLLPEVMKFPKSLIDDPMWTNFLGEDCTATLIHLYGSTFRLIIRVPPTPDREVQEGHSVDVIFNEFVMANFFETHHSADAAELVGKVSQGVSLTEVERTKLKRYVSSQHSCVLLSQDTAKVVVCQLLRPK